MSDSAPNFFNRELSWLAFNERVLEEAQDVSNPPLERLKFLAITASNMDEFFMVRVGGLQSLVEQGSPEPDPAGLTPAAQLEAVSARAHAFAEAQDACFGAIESCLAGAGLQRLVMTDLTLQQTQYVEHVFEHEIFPLITPRAAPSAKELPLLPGLAICLVVRLRTAAAKTRGRRTLRTALVPLPRAVSRFVTIETEKGARYVLVEDIIRAFAARIFPGETVVESATLRITRNADMTVREDLACDLLAQMKRVLDQRRESACVRLQLDRDASPALRAFLMQALHVSNREVYGTAAPLALDGFFPLALLPGFNLLRDKPWDPQPPPLAPAGESIFATLARQDLLLAHPYDSFDPVLRLANEAADDPDVLAIKQILYRTSRNSPIIAALARAAEQGKNVTAIVELKARFDEERNIEWARALEQAGVQVIYGIKGLKTHAKLCLVIRREASGIRRYMHFGTGNYNEITARLYTDISLLTANADLAADASLFFNTITGYAQPARYRKLAAAPLTLRERLLELIDGEIQRIGQGQPARIQAKLNSLVDPELIEALYAASRAGVQVDLNVRGICCLRPGVPGLSQHIRVVSIVDRFLEHSRILCVEHGGDQQWFISSADWMPRNLDRRIELLVPIEDPVCRQRLRFLMDACLTDTVKGRRLQADGRYTRAYDPAAEPRRAQETLWHDAVAQARATEESEKGNFQPLRPSNGKRSAQ